MKYFVLMVITLLTFSNGWSQNSGESRTKNLLGQKQYAADAEVTDSKIKADMGSMSQFSGYFSLSYSGPPVGDVTERNQPNPDGSIGNYATTVSGIVAFRYRLDPYSTVSLGSGLSAVAPFHDNHRYDLRNPQIGIDRTFRFSGFQTRQAIYGAHTTVQEYLNVGEIGYINYSSSNYYGLMDGRILVGGDTSFAPSIYSRRYIAADRTAARYTAGIFPTIKYKATDKFSIYGSYGFNFTNARKQDDQWQLMPKSNTARLGLEYSLTRDIYFAPNLSAYADNMRWDSTTVNLTTVFSVL